MISIVSKVFSYLVERKRLRLVEAYKRGFVWAMDSYFIEGKSLGEIEALSNGSFLGASQVGVRFDSGAVEALCRLVRDFDDGTTCYLSAFYI
jgi:hypothetical protein